MLFRIQTHVTQSHINHYKSIARARIRHMKPDETDGLIKRNHNNEETNRVEMIENDTTIVENIFKKEKTDF